MKIARDLTNVPRKQQKVVINKVKRVEWWRRLWSPEHAWRQLWWFSISMSKPYPQTRPFFKEAENLIKLWHLNWLRENIFHMLSEYMVTHNGDTWQTDTRCSHALWKCQPAGKKATFGDLQMFGDMALTCICHGYGLTRNSTLHYFEVLTVRHLLHLIFRHNIHICHSVES